MRYVCLLLTFCLLPSPALSAPPEIDTSRGDRMIADYFAAETAKLQEACLKGIDSLEDWQAKREEYRRQLLEMLGLDPLPEKTPLEATVTGKVEHEDFTVENLHYQSRPGLYVTGNLYVPKNLEGPAPAVLYVCGHAQVKKDDIAYGNKTAYQHHGAWFARNGYVCLTIDTLQLGEIEGIHHGTYRYDMWWWLNRGYTPAGVEAWNCVRALDYLQSRPEVDGERIGVTGRSGGGAYSWWIAAIDDRIQCAVPVAGITDLDNHVVDGTVEGHCDCMFMVNTYRWDYPLVAALVAPRPLLITNTDSDGIFPLDGVVQTFQDVRKIYALHKAADKIGLSIGPGPHKDIQEIQVDAFRWLNFHLKGDSEPVEDVAVKLFEPEQLKVFPPGELPEERGNEEIHETFVAAAESPEVPETKEAWNSLREGWRTALLEKSFRGWPKDAAPLDVKEAFSVERQGVKFAAYDFTSQQNIRLRLYVAHRAGLDDPELTVLNVLNADSWNEFLATYRPAYEDELKDETLPEADAETFKQTHDMFQSFPWVMAYVAPRGVGPTAWDQSERKQTQHRRRFYLLGQTLDGMQVWDVRRAIQAVRSLDATKDSSLWLQSDGPMAGVALYASLFEPDIARLDLNSPPLSHRDGPFLLNVRRYLDLPQTAAMAAENSQVVIYQEGEDGWEWPAAVIEKLGWGEKRLQLRRPPQDE
ncbi:MAG: acetylxylan esterase [Planctomycetes bacterium]|nr:acetylxylan esterase [Planctomycetota bacterium]